MINEVKKYQIIYADPPWHYHYTKSNGSAVSHYPTMSTVDICKLDIQRITDKNCVLFLWATFPNLIEAFKVIHAWGFQYKTVAFVWIKQNRKSKSLFFGLGNWTRANAEICLLATKGTPKRVSAKVRQVIITPIEEHSKKPAEARYRIEDLMGDLPRIELFARMSNVGWDVWGNEIDSDIQISEKEV